jgi:NitT/TauT family transport system substrate-binding protein
MAIVPLSIALLMPAPKLRVGIKPWVGFSPLAVADDLQLCQGIDLVLTPVEDHDDALARLSRGELDAVLCPLEGHVLARAAGYRTKAVLKLDESLTADAIVARAPIRSPGDLMGKQVVFVQMDVPQYLFLAFAERHGLTTKNVTVMAVPTAEEAVARFIHDETIAAVAIYEPYLQRALEQVPGAHLLTTAEQEGGAVVDMLTIDETYLDSYPDRVQALAQGWYQAIELLRKRDPRALHSACRFLGGNSGPTASETQYDQMTAGMQYSDQHDNEQFFATDAAGGSQFRDRTRAAHLRLAQWQLLRDTTKLNPADADGSAVLSVQSVAAK